MIDRYGRTRLVGLVGLGRVDKTKARPYFRDTERHPIRMYGLRR